jgi:UDP-glucose 4-epimerase
VDESPAPRDDGSGVVTTPSVALVTGGAGFIGSHLVDTLLDRGWHVRVLDNFNTGKERNLAQHAGNRALTVERRDIRELEPGDAIFSDVDVVFHIAGIGEIVPSVDNPRVYMATNVHGTVQVLECARHAGVKKLVYAASSSCYGLAATPTAEDHAIAPQYPYALSKYQGEQAAFHWHQVYRLPVNSIRIFNAYGVRSLTTGAYGAVFGVFLRQKLAGRPFTVVGDGRQRRDFLYVTDVADAFYRAGTGAHTGRIWNLGAGRPQSVNRLVELLGGPVVHIPERPGEPACTWAETGRIRAELGWRPQVSFEEGVARVLENIEQWRDAPLWDPASIAQATSRWFAMLSADRETT